MKIVLASKSPRRKELLNTIVDNFEIIEAVNDEVIMDNLTNAEQSEHLSFEKANEVFEKTNGDRIVIGSDTIVVVDNVIYGKPRDEKHAFEMLKILSGNTHQVITGICVLSEINGVKSCYIDHDTADVKFVKMEDKEILDYISTKEPMDKAGSYGVQGKGGKFIENINGSFYTIMGLPIHLVYRQLKNLGIFEN